MSTDTMTALPERYGWRMARGYPEGQWEDPLRPRNYSSLAHAYNIQRFRCRNLKRWKDGYRIGVGRGKRAGPRNWRGVSVELRALAEVWKRAGKGGRT